MSSYNRVEKIKYTKNESEVVALSEYILFENTRAEEKVIVFKFVNNLNQCLRALKFEVSQYNEAGELIEKSVASHEDFVAEANAPFVPNAKLRVSFLCKRVEVRLLYAAFDRVKWENGEFLDNSYKFGEFAATLPPAPPANLPPPPVAMPPLQKLKYGFSIRNVTRQNIARFPAVYRILVCILVVAFVVGSAIFFRHNSNKYHFDGFDLAVYSENSVSVCGYDGWEKELVIPAQIGGYTVTGIAKGAFKGSPITSVSLQAESLMIESGAFENCRRLVSVTQSENCAGADILSGAFEGCSSLRTVELPAARLAGNSLSGCPAIETLVFDCMLSSGDLPLIRLFGDVEEYTLKTFRINAENLPDHFFSGITLG